MQKKLKLWIKRTIIVIIIFSILIANITLGMWIGFKVGVYTLGTEFESRIEPLCYNDLVRIGYNSSCLDICYNSSNVNMTKYNCEMGYLCED